MASNESLTWQDKVLIFFVVLLIIILIVLILIFFCRHRLAKWFPCLVVKIKPEEKTGWHHLDRFGEVKLKSASHSVPEMRARRGAGEDSVEEGSVQTNISLQVPVFEEKLNSTVTKKSVHVASADLTPAELETPKKKKKKRSKTRSGDQESSAHSTPAHEGYGNRETIQEET